MNAYLQMSDVVSSAQNIPHPEIPCHLNEVIFDVRNFVKSILNDVSQKYELLKKDGSSQEYSLIDIRNFRNMSVKDLEELFLVNFKLSFEKETDREKINLLYQKAIDVIQSRYGHTIIPELAHKNISQMAEVKEMLDISGKGKKGVQVCAISKVFLSLALLHNDSRISYIDKIHSEISNDLCAPISNHEELAVGLESGNLYIDELDTSIPVHMIHRAKTIASCVGKQMGNINYNSVDDYKDLHGFTIELDTSNTKEVIFILQKYYHILINKAQKAKSCESNEYEIELENKNLLSMNDVLEMENELDSDFFNFLINHVQGSLSKSQQKRKTKGTAQTYQDVKFTLKYKTKDPTNSKHGSVYSGTEVKFTLKGNSNESGLAFHSIFDYKKRFREMTRIFGFLHHEDILYYVNEFFEGLDEKLLKKGKSRSHFFKELIHDFKVESPDIIPDNFEYNGKDPENLKAIKIILYKYLLKDVVEVKISKSSKHTFLVHKSYFDLTPELNKEVIPV